jgi:hypothetical protein
MRFAFRVQKISILKSLGRWGISRLYAGPGLCDLADVLYAGCSISLQKQCGAYDNAPDATSATASSVIGGADVRR